ncbi:hypothetical protein MHO82_10175 [Vibrio sp. Of7-15]|uniref:hypothetical protein n=1 Tax=Vibrio sp. Of7-15 TaxID=2724879 RepID=UPI001EF197C0|nr:hypothetical protein [Vibrio sp. Of7-15]MCG7497235.1 hypothetical protein [Vibrio sp. Of7-15]
MLLKQCTVQDGTTLNLFESTEEAIGYVSEQLLKQSTEFQSAEIVTVNNEVYNYQNVEPLLQDLMNL